MTLFSKKPGFFSKASKSLTALAASSNSISEFLQKDGENSRLTTILLKDIKRELINVSELLEKNISVFEKVLKEEKEIVFEAEINRAKNKLVEEELPPPGKHDFDF